MLSVFMSSPHVSSRYFKPGCKFTFCCESAEKKGATVEGFVLGGGSVVTSSQSTCWLQGAETC